MRTTSTFGRILGELEHQIMRVIWAKQSGASAREVLTELTDSRLAYTTVVTVMNRLCLKGLLSRREQSQPHLYRAKYSPREFYNSVADRLLTTIRSQFGDVAVACFVEEAQKVSRKKFRKILSELKRRGK